MSETDTRQPAETGDRKPWQPLGFDKISAAEAESGITGIGADAGFYS